MRAIGALTALAGLFFGVLFIVNSAIPIFYPDVLRGPFVVDEVQDTERFAGFSPLTPFYRPEKLGREPISITVTQRPKSRVVILWQGESFLYLSQEETGDSLPKIEKGRSFPGFPESSWRRDGAAHHVFLRQDGRLVEIRTDLEEEDLSRILKTLRPIDEQL